MRRFRFPISGYMEIDAEDKAAAVVIVHETQMTFTDHRKQHNAFCYAVGVANDREAYEIDPTSGRELCKGCRGLLHAGDCVGIWAENTAEAK